MKSAIKGILDFLKSLSNAIPSQCVKNAAKNLEECGSIPKSKDIPIFRQPIGSGSSRFDFTEISYNNSEGRSQKLGNFSQSSAQNCPDSVFAKMAAEQQEMFAIRKEASKLLNASIKDWAKAAGAVATAYAASQLAGCAPGGKEQESYDVFDASPANLEGDVDPVESIQRAIRQAQRNQQNGRGGCDDCTHSLVEVGGGGGGNTNYGNSCEPPDKFKPPTYNYPGYMELRKKCQ